MPRQVAGFAVERTDVAKNGAGTLTLTGASQVLVPANKDRVSLWINNNSATNKMWMAYGTAAAANTGLPIPAGTTIGPFTHFTGAVNIIGTAADVVTFIEV